MDINVRDIRKVTPGISKLLAIVDIEMAGLVIRGLRILNGRKGPWISWPSKKWTRGDGSSQWTYIVEPATAEVRKAVTDAVLRAWGDHGQSPTSG